MTAVTLALARAYAAIASLVGLFARASRRRRGAPADQDRPEGPGARG